jgi:hypothetical protein
MGLEQVLDRMRYWAQQDVRANFPAKPTLFALIVANKEARNMVTDFKWDSHYVIGSRTSNSGVTVRNTTQAFDEAIKVKLGMSSCLPGRYR